MSSSVSVENALFGKTKQDLLACTAVSSSKRTQEEVTQQLFYQGASLFGRIVPGIQRQRPPNPSRVSGSCPAERRSPRQCPLPRGSTELCGTRPLRRHL